MSDPRPHSPSSPACAGAAQPDAVDTSAAALWGLLPCAGSGSRAGTALPKQYQVVAGRAMVLHTLAAFTAVPRLVRTLVVVAPQDSFVFPRDAGRWLRLACGGPTRARSVANGLQALLDLGARAHDWVLVHDAARCLITPDLIDALIDACMADPVGGLLAQPVPDTLKRAGDGRVLQTLDRRQVWQAQTPQMFRIGALRSALQMAGDAVTDESSAMEAAGLAPKIVPGSALNFKVTYPEDFALAQAVLSGRRRMAENGRPPHEEPDYDYP